MEFQPTTSIYLQIADSISERIINGIYANGEKVPSVRELAIETGVNPNTIMRTYAELQSQQIIDNKRGVGFFVNPEAKKIILEKRKSKFFNQMMPEFLRQASLLGISLEDIIEQSRKK